MPGILDDLDPVWLDNNEDNNPMIYGDNGKDMLPGLVDVMGGAEKTKQFIDHLKTGRLSSNVQTRGPLPQPHSLEDFYQFWRYEVFPALWGGRVKLW